MKREHGADDPNRGQCHGCPRNCKRIACLELPLMTLSHWEGPDGMTVSQETCHRVLDLPPVGVYRVRVWCGLLGTFTLSFSLMLTEAL